MCYTYMTKSIDGFFVFFFEIILAYDSRHGGGLGGTPLKARNRTHAMETAVKILQEPRFILRRERGFYCISRGRILSLIESEGPTSIVKILSHMGSENPTWILSYVGSGEPTSGLSTWEVGSRGVPMQIKISITSTCMRG